jgi:hypothetical protein
MLGKYVTGTPEVHERLANGRKTPAAPTRQDKITEEIEKVEKALGTGGEPGTQGTARPETKDGLQAELDRLASGQGKTKK